MSNEPNPDWGPVKAEREISINLKFSSGDFAIGEVVLDGKEVSLSTLFEKSKGNSFIDSLVDHAKTIYKQSI